MFQYHDHLTFLFIYFLISSTFSKEPPPEYFETQPTFNMKEPAILCKNDDDCLDSESCEIKRNKRSFEASGII